MSYRGENSTRVKLHGDRRDVNNTFKWRVDAMRKTGLKTDIYTYFSQVIITTDADPEYRHPKEGRE